MSNNVYVNCYYYGFYTSQENLRTYNLSAEKLTRSQQKISQYFNQKKYLKKVQSLTKELETLENLEKLNLKKNNNNDNINNNNDNNDKTKTITENSEIIDELINYNFSNISKKIVEQLYNYDYNYFYYLFCVKKFR